MNLCVLILVLLYAILFSFCYFVVLNLIHRRILAFYLIDSIIIIIHLFVVCVSSATCKTKRFMLWNLFLMLL